VGQRVVNDAVDRGTLTQQASWGREMHYHIASPSWFKSEVETARDMCLRV